MSKRLRYCLEIHILMFKEEYLWIKKALAKIELDNVHTCLNVGSGSLTFRTARAELFGIDSVRQIYYFSLAITNSLDPSKL